MAPYPHPAAITADPKKVDLIAKSAHGVATSQKTAEWSRFKTPLKKKMKTKPLPSQDKQGAAFKRESLPAFGAPSIGAVADGRHSTGVAFDMARPLEGVLRPRAQPAKSEANTAKKKSRNPRQG